jgi:hypothetical protein
MISEIPERNAGQLMNQMGHGGQGMDY